MTCVNTKVASNLDLQTKSRSRRSLVRCIRSQKSCLLSFSSSLSTDLFMADLDFSVAPDRESAYRRDSAEEMRKSCQSYIR